MDATRYRRSKSAVHQQWYARWRLVRFASHLGFLQQQVSAATDVGATPPSLPKEVRCWQSRTAMDALN